MDAANAMVYVRRKPGSCQSIRVVEPNAFIIWVKMLVTALLKNWAIYPRGSLAKSIA